MIVHAVWLGPLNAKVEGQLSRLLSRAAPHDVMLHSDESLLPAAWGDAYSRLCVFPQMKADLLRLAALRTHGGLYLDVDVTVRASIDEIAAAMSDTYCAVHLSPFPFIGGDILWCPQGWEGWGLVDEYISLASKSGGPVPFVHFTHSLSAFLAQRGACRILSDATLFPVRKQDVTPASLVCRGFECAGQSIHATARAGAAGARIGPGGHLKAMLARWLGIAASPTCPCNAHAAQMDMWGPDECEKRVDEIAGWLESEASKRRLPFVRMIATQMVRLAIRRARKDAAQ